MWTLVGGGEKTLQDSAKEMSKLMPKNATWIKEKVEQFDPAQNLVYTSDNKKVIDFLFGRLFDVIYGHLSGQL